jgi:hypothetical protein
MNDNRLSELYRLGTRPPERRDGCLTPEHILAAIDGPLDARERAADHAGQCSACAEEIRVALGLREGLAEPSRRPASATASWLRLAAAVAIGAGLALLALRTGNFAPEPPSPTRGESEIVWPGTTPPDGARLTSAPTALAWAARPGATSYRVALYDEESSLLWEGPPGADPRVELSAEAVSRLQRGGTFYWRVTIRGSGGGSTSPLLRFDVRP